MATNSLSVTIRFRLCKRLLITRLPHPKCRRLSRTVLRLEHLHQSLRQRSSTLVRRKLQKAELLLDTACRSSYLRAVSANGIFEIARFVANIPATRSTSISGIKFLASSVSTPCKGATHPHQTAHPHPVPTPGGLIHHHPVARASQCCLAGTKGGQHEIQLPCSHS